MSKFCWLALSEYSEQNLVREHSLKNLEHISKEIQQEAIKLIVESFILRQDLDNFLNQNKGHTLLNKLKNFAKTNEIEFLELTKQSPVLVKKYFPELLQILSSKTSEELIDYFITANPEILNYFQSHLGNKINYSNLNSKEENESKEINQNAKYATVNESSGLFLREDCSTSSTKLILIPFKEKVEIISKENQDRIYEKDSYWYRVKFRGKVGCSFGAFLEF